MFFLGHFDFTAKIIPPDRKKKLNTLKMTICLQLLPIHTMLVMAAGLNFLFLKQDKTRPFVNTFITQVGHLADSNHIKIVSKFLMATFCVGCEMVGLNEIGRVPR